MWRSAILFCVLFAFVWLAFPTSIHSQPEALDEDRIARATVLIMQTRASGDDVLTCVGSGTVVSRDGLILTNAHHVVPNSTCPGEALVVAVMPEPGQSPIARYRAEIAAANRGLDLALLRVTAQLDGRPVDRNLLALPFVELGDSSAVTVDDTIYAFGYPDLIRSSVEQRIGTVSGFVSEPSAADRAWIKIEADVPGVMTGGGLYNQQGQLIGVPSTIALSDAADTSCPVLEDYNQDGVINQDDRCVPVGGFINAVRPSSFARPLLRAASLGLQVRDTSANAQPDSATPDPPTFSRLFFSTAVRDNMPVRVVDNVGTTSSLYLFFDYANMTPDTIYELRVTVNGVFDPVLSLSPVRWSGGLQGLWYIGASDRVWPNGEYVFTLLINGTNAGSQSIRTGLPTTGQPEFNNILFGTDDAFSGTGYVLPTGNAVNARFNFNNMQASTPWSALWYFNGTEIAGSRTDNTWAAANGTNGSFSISLLFDAGLLPGRYRLELYIENGLAATADFTVAGAREGPFPRVFTNARFVQAASPEAAVSTTAQTTFPAGGNAIYALFDWEQLAPGTLWTLRWTVDGNTLFEQTLPWQLADTGQNYLIALEAERGLPDGTYRMELLINGVRLADYTAQVGIGQLPIDVFAQTQGVLMRGEIRDAATGEGIEGMTFVVITEDFSVADFVWDSEQIYALATTDRNGRFQIDRPLQFGPPYSVIIAGRGYLPISADGVIVDEDTPNPLEVVIYMTQG